METNDQNNTGDAGKNPDENNRIRELLRYNILDTPDEREFDDLTKLAAYLCDTDRAMINFLNHDRQWSKSCLGWDLKEMPRNKSICTHTIQEDNYLILNGVDQDSRFKDLDYVKETNLKFYAGVVLRSTNGYKLGTLCVFDDKPRNLTVKQLESLQILGKEVEAQLELRLKREQLIEEHKKFKKTNTFLLNSADLMLILNPDTLEVEEINEEVKELLGFRPEEIIGTPLTDYITEPEFADQLESWSTTISAPQYSLEAILETKEGKSVWFQITITEELGKYYFTGRDITRRKRAEQRLLKQMKFTEDIIEHLPGIFFLTDDEGRIKKWNNNLEKISKRTSEEVKNETYEKFIAREDHHNAAEALQEIFKKGYARTELTLITKNGESIPLLLVGFRYQMNNNTYAIGIGINISEEKAALKELEDKEDKLNETLRHLEKAQRIAKMGSWNWDVTQNEVTWSDEVYEILGLDKKSTDPSLELFFNMMPENEMEEMNKLLDHIMEGRGMNDIEHKIRRSDSSIIYVHQRGEAHYDSEDNPIRVSGTIQDVTTRRKAEEKIKTALKEKEVLLTEVHHRVKNNLAIINSFLQLETFNADDEKLKKILTESQMRIHSMALIHETLYSSGNFADISFGNYLEQFAKSALETFTKKPQKIDIQMDVEDLSLNINQAIPCALIVNELFTNSLKHAFPNTKTGIISISLQEKENKIHLGLEDNGVGLDNDLDLENPATLGLTLIKTLLKQLNGELDVVRKNGASFKISFEKKKTSGSSANIFFQKDT